MNLDEILEEVRATKYKIEEREPAVQTNMYWKKIVFLDEKRKVMNWHVLSKYEYETYKLRMGK